MIYRTALFKLKPETTSAELEEMIRSTRTHLLRIPETLSVKSGKNVDGKAEWPFFFSVEVESLNKLKLLLQDAHYLKFLDAVITPKTTAKFELDFELDPARDTKYS